MTVHSANIPVAALRMQICLPSLFARDFRQLNAIMPRPASFYNKINMTSIPFACIGWVKHLEERNQTCKRNAKRQQLYSITHH